MRYRKWVFPASFAVLCVSLAVFFAGGEAWIAARRAVLAPQLTTSLNQFGGKLLLAAGVLVLTVLLGRWYCLVLCPAGTTQEVFSRLGGRLGLRRLGFRKRGRVAGGLALFVGAALIVGYALPANLADPIGMFGRIAQPAGGAAREIAAGRLPGVGRDWGYLFLVAAFGIFPLVVVPVFRGRVFCDRFCPVGFVLGLLAALNRRTAAILPEACVSCGRCATVCPTRCADGKGRVIEAERCLGCGECARVCGVAAIGGGRETEKRAEGVRRFGLGFLAAAGYVLARPLAGVLRLDERKDMAMADDAGVAPPGSGGDWGHRRKCVACQACVSACPAGIIRPGPEDLRPLIDFDYGFCQYNCQECARSCPAGVFKPMPLEEKKTTRIARTEFSLDRCVVVSNGTECGACAEVCPTHAVTMTEQGTGLPTRPDFDAAYCIGCGGCYHVCPAEPRAFAIAGLSRHERSLGIRDVAGHPDAGETTGAREDIPDFPF